MKMNRGRPLSFMTRIMRDAPADEIYSIPLQPSQFLPTMYVAIEDLQCSICNCIVDQQWKHPVEGMCGHFVLSIFFVRVMTLPHFRAFCKEIHEFFDSSYPPGTEMVVKMLVELLLTCPKCSITHASQSFPFIIINPRCACAARAHAQRGLQSLVCHSVCLSVCLPRYSGSTRN